MASFDDISNDLSTDAATFDTMHVLTLNSPHKTQRTVHTEFYYNSLYCHCILQQTNNTRHDGLISETCSQCLWQNG